MKLQENIDSYIEVMKEIQSSINDLQGEKFLVNHKKTLLLSLVETISKGTYGDIHRNNFDRFQNFIMEFCEWKEANKVSLQQLALLLDNTQDHEYQRLKKHVSMKIQKYPIASAVPFKYDSTLEEIKAVMPKGITAINGVDINSFTHVNLLWKYRNSLVHEARSLGGTELFDHVDFPHYTHYTMLERDGKWEVWKITYPIQFFNDLIEKALVNVREKLVEIKRNPRSNYDFGELWIKPRNRRG
ncbi:hypothetical protein [Rossellomorea marisflavi]|uniref:hypothetical protein n=1 Tax=Rossellomorea marisflavi TaxID=189381 RepID=UPI00345DC1E2